VGDEDPQLGRRLLPGAHLLHGASPQPQLVGDHAGVARVGLGLARVGVARPVDGDAGNMEDPLAALDQDRLEERRWPSHKVKPDRAFPAQPFDLRADGLEVFLHGFDLA
jgi:hypothetical protein